MERGGGGRKPRIGSKPEGGGAGGGKRVAERSHQAGGKTTGKWRGVGHEVEKEREEEAGGNRRQVPSGSR